MFEFIVFTYNKHNSIKKIQKKNYHKNKSHTNIFFLSKLIKLIKLINIIYFYQKHLNIIYLQKIKTYSKQFTQQIPKSTLQNISITTKHIKHNKTKHYTNINKNKTLNKNKL